MLFEKVDKALADRADPCMSVLQTLCKLRCFGAGVVGGIASRDHMASSSSLLKLQRKYCTNG